jgi:hypothetical protein
LFGLHKNSSNKIQSSGNFPYGTSVKSMEIFMGLMEKYIYGLMQTSLYLDEYA